jgi:hypothetical protein
MKKLISLSCIVIGLLGCNSKDTGKQKVETDLVLNAPAAVEQKAMADKPAHAGQSAGDVTRKIIKEGEISFETKNIPATRKAIYNSLQKLGGYIAEENETNDSIITHNQYVLKARIPEKNFDLFLNNVSSNATRIASKNIRARDVTAEYIDVTTHLANKKKLEDRYVELLKKGNKISDLLEIENKISEIQTSIDSTQGQLNYLVNRVEYSSLDITFYTKQTVKDNAQTFGYRFVSALSGGWDILVALFFGVISVWPLWIIAIAMYFVFKAWYKKHSVKKE